MKKIKIAFIATLLSMSLVSCFTHEHVVGNGASGSNSTEKKQWFVLWGLVPINTVDSKAMAGGATNYTIKTQESFIDCLISIVTSVVTVSPRTVTVTK